MKTSYNTNFSDGTNSVNSSSLDGALRVVANRYSKQVSDLVTDTNEDRTLVWLDEASAENDNGAKAVAEIVPA